MLINADAARLPILSRSVHCAITSPPYYSLRRYSGAQERVWPAVEYAPMVGLPAAEVPEMRCALGLEPTPGDFVGHIVAVCREVRRVLRNDGVFWLNMGDAFTSGSPGINQGMKPVTWSEGGKIKKAEMTRMGKVKGINAGNLMMIPHRLALALQADGWIVRNDLVWKKSNPMPESLAGWAWQRCKVKIASGKRSGPNPDRNDGGESAVGNKPYGIYKPCPGCPKCADNDGYVLKRGSWRHTRAHEYVMMLTKKMNYWCNQEIVRETLASADRIDDDGYFKGNRRYETRVDEARMGGVRDNRDAMNKAPSGRNPRSVLVPKSSSYSGAHFAVFPPSLIAPLIRAATPARCCPVCGSGWSPVVERTGGDAGESQDRPKGMEAAKAKQGGHGTPTSTLSISGRDGGWQGRGTKIGILGHRPTCSCFAPHNWQSLGTYSRDTGKEMLRCERCGIGNWTPPASQPCKVPGLVFDPFLGSGTTAMVARELGLRWIGTDLSFEYLDLQAKVRSKSGTPSNWAEGLPMFEELSE